ncbi:MAG: aminomethyl-transferring glycine dehydrogenase [Corynebacterium sp.]|nr:aminomethyl-transferring glycine dehydrogenase [Corynebacterium sp.]
MSFIDRHLGPRSADAEQMLETLGYSSLDALMDAVVPSQIRLDGELQLPAPLSEHEALSKIAGYAAKNKVLAQMIGAGYYDAVTPAVLRRNILENPGFYTSYTPYQAEISQGRLEALLNFQNTVMELTGLEIANSSLLDEASAVAEAAVMMHRANRKVKNGFFAIDSRCLPQVISVTRGRAEMLGIPFVITDFSEGLPEGDLYGIVLAYPGNEGDIRDIEPLIKAAKERNALVTVAADLLALTLLKSPGELGADIAVGNTQRFGLPFFFGGPHAGYMAVHKGMERTMPGRLVGVSKDSAGKPAYRLALQTREQHIRRERATSNICTAQALLANVASMYAVYHGPQGLKAIAQRVHALASSFAQAVKDAGKQLVSEDFFDTVTVAGVDAATIKTDLQKEGYLVRTIGEDKVSVSFGESATKEDVAKLAQAFGANAAEADFALPENLQRGEEPLQHEIFNRIHSETQMLRYLRKLADKDLALDRTMIPLGSCTMKLNPTAAMEPISWPEFAGIHPYAPEETTAGWRALVEEIEGWLAEVTGYAKVSIQPNAGSQGELAGLLAIRRYHVANGGNERDVVLIPASAHGTNAASATLANLRVVVVKTAEDGSIDLADLDEKIAKHGNHIAGIMVTYPSTHGVFDPEVRDVCDKVHAVGGQVYIDGANMNALTGWARPGQFGGDVSHLNLHKTFTIPHGGGGPGVGPVAVAEHLIPFLPTNAADPQLDATTATPVGQGVPITNTKYGSAGVLPISWAYLAMTGAQGLAQASAHAILGANYLAKSLEDSFPVLYTGNAGLVAHECILDLRALTDASGVTAADVAKRLVDFGFHAPTLAFPGAGTLMGEPTESEDLGELDRFIEAMRTIRAEIQEIIDGEVSYEGSVIHHAPFTAESVGADAWEFAFSREKAAWPVKSLRHSYKYFPPVRRIDEAYGDRNLVCSCPPPEAFDIDDSEE